MTNSALAPVGANVPATIAAAPFTTKEFVPGTFRVEIHAGRKRAAGVLSHMHRCEIGGVRYIEIDAATYELLNEACNIHGPGWPAGQTVDLTFTSTFDPAYFERFMSRDNGLSDFKSTERLN